MHRLALSHRQAYAYASGQHDFLQSRLTCTNSYLLTREHIKIIDYQQISNIYDVIHVEFDIHDYTKLASRKPVHHRYFKLYLQLFN